MSQMTFSILDARHAIHSQPHASFAHTLIPALCDDPETIEELRHSMRRFLAPDDDRDPLAGWSRGDCDEPFDAGICIVDLAARLIVFQSTYCGVLRSGEVTFDDAEESTRLWIPYHIAPEWLITEQLDGWRAQADELRRARQANPPFDTRAVLYGEAVPFIVDECLAARGGSTDCDGLWTPPAGWRWRELPERATAGNPPTILDGIAEIHARWLMTPRDDLRRQAPRQVLHAKRCEISQQVEDRELQWSNFGASPPPLWRKSIAYRLGGYGTHEIVVYYELLRHLLHECWDLLVSTQPEQPGITRAEAIERLRMIQQEWLHTPNRQDFSGKSPLQVVERERQRLPIAATAEEIMIDCDCPVCQMMASNGPSFWHLDGCNMDDDFPFSLFASTREEWEVGRRDWAAFADKQERARTHGTADEFERLVLDEDPVNDGGRAPLWQFSFVRSQPAESRELTLLGLGCRLAELVVDLRSDCADSPSSGCPATDQSVQASAAFPASKTRATASSQFWIDTLNSDFKSLREAITGRAPIEPVAVKFTEHLLALADIRSDLRAKCLDLDRQLFDFARRLDDESD